MSDIEDELYRQIRSGGRQRLIGGSDVCETCRCHCVTAEDDEKEIARLRKLCSLAFRELNKAVGNSWVVHDTMDSEVFDQLADIATEERKRDQSKGKQ